MSISIWVYDVTPSRRKMPIYVKLGHGPYHSFSRKKNKINKKEINIASQ